MIGDITFIDHPKPGLNIILELGDIPELFGDSFLIRGFADDFPDFSLLFLREFAGMFIPDFSRENT